MLLTGMKLSVVTQKLNNLQRINIKKANSYGFAFFFASENEKNKITKGLKMKKGEREFTFFAPNLP